MVFYWTLEKSIGIVCVSSNAIGLVLVLRMVLVVDVGVEYWYCLHQQYWYWAFELSIGVVCVSSLVIGLVLVFVLVLDVGVEYWYCVRQAAIGSIVIGLALVLVSIGN